MAARSSSCRFRRGFAAATFGPARTRSNCPAIVVNFYDENRAPIGEAVFGSWRGTFDWQTETRSAQRSAEEPARPSCTSVLLGAVGEISFDEIKLTAVKK